MNVFEAVEEFHKKFGVHWHKKPELLNEHLFDVRSKFLGEELNEFVAAGMSGDLAGSLDAMIDIIYVAAGTLHLMGFSAEQQTEAFRRVHEANMKKRKARSEKESKRGTLFDVVKPAGWQPPNLEDLCR